MYNVLFLILILKVQRDIQNVLNDILEFKGLKYLSSRDKEEFDRALKEFVEEKSDKPILFEVFTKKETDARILLDYYEVCKKNFTIIDKV